MHKIGYAGRHTGTSMIHTVWPYLALMLLIAGLFPTLERRTGWRLFKVMPPIVMVYLLVNVLIAPGSMTPETRDFTDAGKLPLIHDLLPFIGITTGRSPLNASIFLAILCCVFVWVFLWHTPWGFELRAVGHNAQVIDARSEVGWFEDFSPEKTDSGEMGFDSEAIASIAHRIACVDDPPDS